MGYNEMWEILRGLVNSSALYIIQSLLKGTLSWIWDKKRKKGKPPKVQGGVYLQGVTNSTHGQFSPLCPHQRAENESSGETANTLGLVLASMGMSVCEWV